MMLKNVYSDWGPDSDYILLCLTHYRMAWKILTPRKKKKQTKTFKMFIAEL